MLIRAFAALLFTIAFCVPARADLIDTAIEVINPDLKPARPVIQCVVFDKKPVKDCAIAQGKAELEKNEDFQRIITVYGLAKYKKWAELVSMLGVTVACTAFEVPGSAIVCDEFGKKIAEYGAKALKLAAKVHEQVGKFVVQAAGKFAKKAGCVTHIYCKDEDEKDPNKFYWSFGGTKMSMTKFDLAAIWSADYAPRIGEGIGARLHDIEKLKRMIAVPPPRMTAMPIAAASIAKSLGGKSAGDLKYFLAEDALGRGSMNATTASWFATGVTGELTNVHLDAFAPFEAEMNARWLTLVNQATADVLEVPADRFLKDRGNWLKLALPKLSFDNFDRTSFAPGWNTEALAGCRKTIEVSGVVLRRWAMGAAAAKDKSKIEGHGAAAWISLTGGLSNWCAAHLDEAIASRRKEFDAAVSWGCVAKANGQRGLDCPAQAVAAKKPGGDPSAWSPFSKGQIGVVPVELCRNAYELYGKTDPQFCSVTQQRETRQPGWQPPAARETSPIIPPVRRVEPQKSTLCLFDAGPRAGERQDYAPMAPLPVGTPCHDGRGSTGRVIAP